MENYAEIFGNIMGKKATILNYAEKTPEYNFVPRVSLKLFPWLFSMYIKKIHFNVLPRILVLYDMFDFLLPFMDRYFFVEQFSIQSKLSLRPLL